jgi:UDP-N-acetylglucosamine 2-epimerase (non-hydrolysing)
MKLEIIEILKEKGYNANRIKNQRKLVLITGHRRENFGNGFLNICNSIKRLAEKFPLVDFVYPVHLNPNVRNAVKSVFGADALNENSFTNQDNVFLIEPLEYLPFVYLMSQSLFLLTDSGGIQEEAPGLGKPVIVMRDTTERPEAIEAGTVMLVGTNSEKIESAVSILLEDSVLYQTMSNANNPYGDGHASERIVDFFMQNF